MNDPALVGEITALAEGHGTVDPADRALLDFRATAVLLGLIRLARISTNEENAMADRSSAERHVVRAERYIGEQFGQIDSLGGSSPACGNQQWPPPLSVQAAAWKESGPSS
ncbi:MAG: hypothetical protein WDO13_12020 [Verrucomicrobiota bacterium]